MEFKSQSKTLLFVIHGPEALRGICERAIWLDHGHLLADGPFDEVLQKYEIACQEELVGLETDKLLKQFTAKDKRARSKGQGGLEPKND